MEYTFTFVSTFGKYLVYLSPILLSLLSLICLFGIIIGRIEGWRTSESLYHAFINATTVGYGDMRPTRPTSRFLSVINAFVGLLLVGLFVGIGVHSVETAVITPT